MVLDALIQDQERDRSNADFPAVLPGRHLGGSCATVCLSKSVADFHAASLIQGRFDFVSGLSQTGRRVAHYGFLPDPAFRVLFSAFAIEHGAVFEKSRIMATVACGSA